MRAAKNPAAGRKRFFQARVREYRKNPVIFAKEVLRFEPDEWQADALTDLAAAPKVAIKSGQGVGKTSLEAVALLWFLCCFPYPRIVATAPTKQQLHDVLWSEVSKWMSKSPLLTEILKWTKTYIYMEGQKHYSIGHPEHFTMPLMRIGPFTDAGRYHLQIVSGRTSRILIPLSGNTERIAT